MSPKDGLESDNRSHDQLKSEQGIKAIGGFVDGGKVVMRDVVDCNKGMGDKYEVKVFQRFINYFIGDSQQQCALRNWQQYFGYFGFLG